jgi:hypothetical protein
MSTVDRLTELRIAYSTLRTEVRAASDPGSPFYSPIAAEREEQRLVGYARQIADLIADREPAELVGAR